MKKRRFLHARRFFRRFNPWLFLACLLIAIIIWCATMYVEDPNELRTPAEEVTAILSAKISV